MKSIFLWMIGTGLMLFQAGMLWAQEEEPKKVELHGYVKYLQTTTITGIPGIPPTTTNNLIHNRLNFAWYPNQKWTVAVEARNRFFYGEQIKLDSTYGDQIDQYNGLVDLSVRWMDNRYALAHSIIDRAYINYATEKWDVRVGRQRINWGVNLVWNPNDLFNAFNFFDFDYEEFPGSDAIRVQYYPGLLSRVELAVSPGRYDSTTVAAALYRFTVGTYDVQAIGGYYLGQVAVGGGWEGNLGNAGFKGEGTYFSPIEGQTQDTTDALGLAVTVDYLFGNGIYASAATLYNSDGGNINLAGGGLTGGLVGLRPSARNLFPATWTYFVQASGNVTPLFSVSGAVMYAPESAFGKNTSILIPTFTYSIKENWDIDLIGQIFLAELEPLPYQHFVSSAFIRLKWSY
ncbi:MAG: hypothetical protein AAF587_06460 [Bacteroidota bacterium]